MIMNRSRCFEGVDHVDDGLHSLIFDGLSGSHLSQLIDSIPKGFTVEHGSSMVVIFAFF